MEPPKFGQLELGFFFLRSPLSSVFGWLARICSNLEMICLLVMLKIFVAVC